MSQGLQLISAVIGSRSGAAVRSLVPGLFTEDERPAVDYMLQHYRVYGELPTLEVMREQGWNILPANQPVDYYLSRVRKRAIGKAWQESHPEFASALGRADTEGGLAVLEQMVRSARSFNNLSSTTSFVDAAELVRADYLEAANSFGLIRGITFGWDVLDRITGGAQGGDVFVFVARPKIGKSWTVLYNALAAWRAGKSVLFISMEMAILQTARRLIALEAGVPPSLLRTGTLSMWGEERLYTALDNVQHGAHFRMVAGDLRKSVEDVDNLCLEFSPDVVYVDAAYLLDPANTGGKFRNYAKHEALQEVLRGLKNISLNRDIPLIITVQFNREGAKAKGGGDLEHVGGSDWIGQIASGVVSVAPGQAPHEKTRRRYKVIAGRDMEMGGEFETNFLFQPLDMGFVREIIQDREAERQQEMAQQQADML